jgi:hypothetical protein
MLLAVEEDAAAILAAPEADRARLIEAFVERHAQERIEALKRLRNPELVPLFLRLLDHPDWRVRHRALLALEACGDARAIDATWPLLAHPHRRLRERAAITLVRLWDGRPAPADWAQVTAREEDFHVRQCLEALARRMNGALPVVRLAEEEVATGRNGVRLVPYVDGAKLPEPAPQGRNPPGTASRWAMPLLGWGEEEVADAPLRSFGEGHPGTDRGACLDGAGVYAAAEGIVRHLGPGTIVLEHQTPRRETLHATYLHVGAVVFVEPGERVQPGQLLGTIGLGFSAENGGVFAHLEYRIGPPAPPDSAYDAARFLALWVDRTAPLLPPLRPLHTSLRSAAREAQGGELGRAYGLATRARDGAEPGSEAHADAVFLLGLLAGAPAKGIERARRLRDAGYPGDALRMLQSLAPRCRGGAGADALDAEIALWNADELFRKALKGEERVDAAARRYERDEAKARDLWRRLLDEYGDTCLRERIEERLK